MKNPFSLHYEDANTMTNIAERLGESLVAMSHKSAPPATALLVDKIQWASVVILAEEVHYGPLKVHGEDVPASVSAGPSTFSMAEGTPDEASQPPPAAIGIPDVPSADVAQLEEEPRQRQVTLATESKSIPTEEKRIDKKRLRALHEARKRRIKELMHQNKSLRLELQMLGNRVQRQRDTVDSLEKGLKLD